MKKVSIIVTVYNVEKYLEKCLETLVNQTLKDIEIIVVNDESPDNSQKIIDDFSKKYPNVIRSYKIKNMGLGGARNFAISKCKGEYIQFVDSDDYISKDMSKAMYEKAKKDNSDIVICGYNVIDEGTKKIINVESAYSPVEKENPLYSLLFGRTSVWNKIYRTELLQKERIEFRSKLWYEDVDFSFKALIKAKKVSFINKPFYQYLIRKGSIMNNNNIERCLEICFSFDEVISFCQKNNIYKEYYSELEFYCIYHIYICAITRIINTSNKYKLKRNLINQLKNYVKCKFPNYKNNKYIKMLEKRKKIVYTLINCHQYRLVEMLFKIKG